MVGTEKDFELIDALFFVAEFLIGFVAVSLNSLVVLAIVKHRSLHSITNGFICNLAAADITVGLFVTPFAAMSYVGYPGNFYGCLFINCILLILTNVSIINLLVIALDRFFAVKSPLRYQKSIKNQALHCGLDAAVAGSVKYWVHAGVTVRQENRAEEQSVGIRAGLAEEGDAVEDVDGGYADEQCHS
uniref:G-protein coupled receptors family 1 profile domain-containing protein n=1 Tax=Biomphalaria glabrata TaxID=6526 RepID=A0A2C9JLH1_BIOGL